MWWEKIGVKSEENSCMEIFVVNICDFWLKIEIFVKIVSFVKNWNFGEKVKKNKKYVWNFSWSKNYTKKVSRKLKKTNTNFVDFL